VHFQSARKWLANGMLEVGNDPDTQLPFLSGWVSIRAQLSAERSCAAAEAHSVIDFKLVDES
jgi:hypothetical protein